jgi:hypothetical protein
MAAIHDVAFKVLFAITSIEITLIGPYDHRAAMLVAGQKGGD